MNRGELEVLGRKLEVYWGKLKSLGWGNFPSAPPHWIEPCQFARQTAHSLTELLIEVAHWHPAHVVLVQEFTLVSLVTQLSQPVFTHYHAVATEMSVGAVCTFIALAV